MRTVRAALFVRFLVATLRSLAQPNQRSKAYVLRAFPAILIDIAEKKVFHTHRAGHTNPI